MSSNSSNWATDFALAAKRAAEAIAALRVKLSQKEGGSDDPH